MKQRKVLVVSKEKMRNTIMARLTRERLQPRWNMDPPLNLLYSEVYTEAMKNIYWDIFGEALDMGDQHE